jgi:2-polyprenyl-6-hydroxyphenyl methylase/3-demethylubiquinone-9 3-methyltransferase
VEVNLRLSQHETLWAARFMSRSSGMNEFWRRVVPRLLRPGLRVLDVGGGRSPLIPRQVARILRLHVVGLDISEAELRAAPAGSYAEMIVGDVTDTRIPGHFDLIFSQAVLEHVRDTRRAIANLSGAMAEGGAMAHFVPCRNAPFAVLNRLLGNKLARRIVHGIYPERKRAAGFRAYYDHCVPSELRRICKECGLEMMALEPYFVSDYFQFFAPAHAIDLCRQLAMYWLDVPDLAETMVVVARKPRPIWSNLSVGDEEGAVPTKESGHATRPTEVARC